MTSKERFINALEMKKVDRVPYGYLWFSAGNAILKKMNTTMKDAYFSPEGIAEAQILARETYHHDNVMSPWGCILVEAEALGTKIRIKENNYPKVETYAIKSAKEHDKIDPEKILTSPRVEVIAESIRILNEKIGNNVFVAATIQAPMMLASQLLDGSQLCLELMTEKDNAHKLFEKLTKALILYADILIDRGAHGIFVENGMNTAELYSPDMAEEFIFKYTKQIYDHIKKTGTYVISQNYAGDPYYDLEFKLKPHALSFAYGNPTELGRKYGIDCQKISSQELIGCKERYCFKELEKENICLMGNINPNVFIKGSRNAIEHEVKSCLNAAPEKGFILSSGGEIPLDTSEEDMIYLWNTIRSCIGK